MKEIRHLDNAPIREAIINIRVTHAEKIPDSTYLEIATALKDLYPKSEQILTHEVGYKIEQGKAETVVRDHGIMGIKLESQDSSYVAHFKSGEFLISRVGQYEDWESLLNEAKRLWKYFLTHLKPLAITRISTRFINELSLPKAEVKTLDDVFESPLKVPKTLPYPVSSFLQRYVIELEDKKARAIVSQVLRAITEQTVEFVLDADVVKNLDMLDPTADKFWSEFNDLQYCKNAVFFESLTDKTIERYV